MFQQHDHAVRKWGMTFEEWLDEKKKEAEKKPAGKMKKIFETRTDFNIFPCTKIKYRTCIYRATQRV